MSQSLHDIAGQLRAKSGLQKYRTLLAQGRGYNAKNELASSMLDSLQKLLDKENANESELL